MSLERVRTLLGNTVDRGRTIHEEQSAVRMALRILKRERPDGDWSRLHIDWPEWYDREGNLKSNHEELRAKRAKPKPVEEPRPPMFYGWTTQQWADHMRRAAWAAEQARAAAEKAKREERERRAREQEARRKHTPAYDRAVRAVNAKPGTVGHMANHLLMRVVRRHVNGASEMKWGLSYGEVLAALKVNFPRNKPTLNTLRWYESKLRTVYGKDAVPRRANDL